MTQTQLEQKIKNKRTTYNGKKKSDTKRGINTQNPKAKNKV